MVWAKAEHKADDEISRCHEREEYFLHRGSTGPRVSFVGGGCRLCVTRRESWQMSQVREPLPPGPEGPEQAPTENSSLISLPREKNDQENTAAGDKDINQPFHNQNIQPEIQDQSVWGNRTDGDLIRRPRNARRESEMFPEHRTAAQRKGMEAAVWLDHQHPGQAAVADEDIDAFVGLKACISSEGRLFACDVVAVFATRQGLSLYFASFWHNLSVCLSQILQHWKGVRKKVAKSKMATWA
ncbi:myoD family inhibitor domain-containing protein isoform 4-T4 [Podargus strigoides]